MRPVSYWAVARTTLEEVLPSKLTTLGVRAAISLGEQVKVPIDARVSSPSDSENALQSIDSWLTEMQGATVVLHPRVETVYSHTVIRFSFDQLLESGGSGRIHGCQRPANDRSYLLQVAGNAAIDQDLQDILGRVVRSFRVMEE